LSSGEVWNHLLHDSGSIVLTATGFVNRNQIRSLLTDRQKISHRWLRRRPLPDTKFSANPSTRTFGQVGEI